MEKRKIEIVNLYKQGVSVKEICAKCKCSTNTISKVLDEFNIPKELIENQIRTYVGSLI